MSRTLVIASALVLATTLTGAAQSKPVTESEARTLNLAAYAELLRGEVRTEKVAILTQVMGFTEAEDKAFWPIYREYDLAMAKLCDERVELIQSYAKNYSNVTDAVADQLATRAMDLQVKRNAALAACYEKVKKATSSRTALRFLQVEHQLLLLTDLQIAASLPIVE